MCWTFKGFKSLTRLEFKKHLFLFFLGRTSGDGAERSIELVLNPSATSFQSCCHGSRHLATVHFFFLQAPPPHTPPSQPIPNYSGSIPPPATAPRRRLRPGLSCLVVVPLRIHHPCRTPPILTPPPPHPRHGRGMLRTIRPLQKAQTVVRPLCACARTHAHTHTHKCKAAEEKALAARCFPHREVQRFCHLMSARGTFRIYPQLDGRQQIKCKHNNNNKKNNNDEIYIYI